MPLGQNLGDFNARLSFSLWTSFKLLLGQVQGVQFNQFIIFPLKLPKKMK